LYFGGHFGFKMATIANRNGKIQNGGRCHGNQGAKKMLNSLQTADPFET
jgi:hypothetical protein